MAIPPVVVEFLAKGIPDIQRAFKSVQQTFEQNERIQTRASETGARARLRSASSEARAKEREFAKTAREAERLEKQRIREAEKAAKAETRAVEQGVRDKIRAMQLADREHRKALEFGVREAEKAAKAEARAFEAAEREKATAAARWVRIREREERESLKRREQFAKAISGGVSRGVGRIAGGVQQLAAGVLNVGGGFSVADSVQREVALRGQAATLAASSQGNFTSDQIIGKARAIGVKQAMNPDDVVTGFTKIKDLTGNLDQAMRVMPAVAKIATATGGEVGEMAELAGNLLMSNPKMSDEDLSRQLRVLAKQGQVGAVEVKDMARLGSRLTAGASLFGGNKDANVATMGAIAQVARQYGGAASPAEAALAAQRFATDVQKHAGDLEASGIKVRDGKGTMRGAKDIMLDMLQKSGGDVTKLTQFGLGERGIRALTGFSSIYRDAGGGEAGKKAVQAEFGKYTSGVTEDDIEVANKKRLSEVDAQLTVAMNDLRAAVGTQLVPELTKLVPLITQLTPQFRSLLEGLIKIANWAKGHPLAGLGVAITALIAKEFAQAKIAQTIQNLLSGKPPPGGAVGGAVGKGLAVVAAGVVGGEAAREWVDENFGEQQSKDNKRRSHQIDAANLIGRLKRGAALSPEERKKAEELVGQLGNDAAQTQNDIDNPSLVKKVTGGIGMVVNPGATAEATAKDAAEQRRMQEASIKAMRELADALKKAPGANSSVDTGSRTQPISARTAK